MKLAVFFGVISGAFFWLADAYPQAASVYLSVAGIAFLLALCAFACRQELR